MKDRKWHDECQTNYNKVANELIDNGYTRSKRSDVYKEQFAKDDQILVIVHSLGSSAWWSTDITLSLKSDSRIRTAPSSILEQSHEGE